MYQRFTRLVLHWMRVPPEPHPPHGAPASLRVFRAGKNFYRLRLARWSVTQLFALAGIIFWVAVFISFEASVHDRQTQQVRVDPRTTRNFEDYLEKIGVAQKANPDNPASQPTPKRKAKGKPRVRINDW